MYSITCDSAPRTQGPFSQGTSAARYVFVSSQLPVDKDDVCHNDDAIESQTERCIDNVAAVLAQLDLTLSDVSKVTIYLASIEDLDAVYTVCEKRFERPRPACSVFQVAALPLGAKVSIEAIACR
ncbi:MAG: Rid family hydrolase [Parolsenella sp.]|uniref:RidA family protein n=1 Tax=Parolsenella sp. TaxID=2083006 RepID=UPI002E76B3B8|nr:Rid family hydrolase [Parolsenella sp.]MEE1372069.1 Rid family hydrolase [Parolsenella sp.]